MRAVLVLLAVASQAFAQSKAAGKPVTGNLGNFKAEDLILKLPHVHWSPVKCKTAPDGVYSKSGRTYYGCIKGKDVCSDEKDVIPKSMIAAFDAKMREHDRNMEAFRASVSQRKADAEPFRPSRRAPAARSANPLAIPRAAPGPAATRITEEQANEIAAGMARSEVIAKLGEPYMKISGDFERFTYLVAAGKLAKIEIEGGKVTRTRIVAE